MPNVVRLDDPTSHGGKVTKVMAKNFTVGGIPVARIGDKCSCPIHGDGVIVQGEPRHTISDRSVAYEGHRTTCGALLISTIKNFVCS